MAALAAFTGDLDKLGTNLGLKGAPPAALRLDGGKVAFQTVDGKFSGYILDFTVVKLVNEPLAQCSFQAWLGGAPTTVDAPKNFSLAYGIVQQEITGIFVHDRPGRPAETTAEIALFCDRGASEISRYSVPPRLDK